MPRKYELGKRAVQQADTHRRIVDAALELYQESGIATTTMLDVARRADVAPGTVANHFGSVDALAQEATARILADLRMPAPDLFAGVEEMHGGSPTPLAPRGAMGSGCSTMAATTGGMSSIVGNR